MVIPGKARIPHNEENDKDPQKASSEGDSSMEYSKEQDLMIHKGWRSYRVQQQVDLLTVSHMA